MQEQNDITQTENITNNQYQNDWQSEFLPLSKDVVGDIPIYFLDSGIVITFGAFVQMRRNGFSRETITFWLKTKANTSCSNASAEELYDLFELNAERKVIFCITPEVYREILFQGKENDDFRVTRDFLRKNCFLAYPAIPLDEFATAVAYVQEQLKSVRTKSGYGLCEQWTKDEETGYYYDKNMSDRIIVSQTAVMGALGLQKTNFVSCAGLTDEELDLIDEQVYIVKDAIDDAIKTKQQVVFENPKCCYNMIQINFRDFGSTLRCSRKEQVVENERQVAEMLCEKIAEIFGENKGVRVLTPEENANLRINN